MKNTPEKWAGLAKAGKNYQADQRQYADFVNVLGVKAPKTFAKFQDLKYNDAEKWEYLKGYKRYKVRVPEAKESDYALYQKVKQNGVVGSVCVPPQPIDARTLSFRDDHAERHGCTLGDAIKYISDAKCSIRRNRWVLTIIRLTVRLM